jgi:hypothetical protein
VSNTMKSIAESLERPIFLIKIQSKFSYLPR